MNDGPSSYASSVAVIPGSTTSAPARPWTTTVRFRSSSLRWTKTPSAAGVSTPFPYRRVLVPSLTSSSSSWSNVSGFQLVAPDAIAASSASFDG